jgi:hypothetical protein
MFRQHLGVEIRERVIEDLRDFVVAERGPRLHQSVVELTVHRNRSGHAERNDVHQVSASLRDRYIATDRVRQRRIHSGQAVAVRLMTNRATRIENLGAARARDSE